MRRINMTSNAKEIFLNLDSNDLEYDIYTLIKAFHPECEIRVCYDREKLPDDAETYCLLRNEKEGEAVFRIMKNGKTEVSASRPVDPETTTRIEAKNGIKQLIYETLSGYLERTLPWGDLTGIRPVKIPMKMLEEGVAGEEILSRMQTSFFVSGRKASLALEIAGREKAILDGINAEEGYSLYIGIPFCPSICLYCSFGSHPLDRFGYLTDDYLEALFRELTFIAEAMKGKILTCIYIGGGTPSSLSDTQIIRLLSFVRETFPCGTLREFTFEAGRPDTVTREKLEILKRFGVDRISINPQTMNDHTLQLIGRAHTAEQTEQAFRIARETGFHNINADIIVGLPGEGEEEVRATMDRLCALEPESITVHSLALKRATRLNLFKDDYLPVAFQNSQSIMDMVERRSARLGLMPYYLYRQKNMAGNFENVGYAKEGCFGLYNILIMEEKQTILAAGSGAVSKYVYPGGRIERTANVKDIHHYIERIGEMIERKRLQLEA